MVTVIVTGAFIGINNTLTTQAVMLVSPVERPVASSAYGFVRFIGGGLAPFVAGRLADRFSLSVPFYVGGVAFILAIFVLASGHRLLAAAEADLVEDGVPEPSRPAGQPSREPSREPRLQGIRMPEGTGSSRRAGHPVIVAVGATTDAADVVRAAAGIAERNRAPLEIVRVHETTVIEELAVDVEDHEGALAALNSLLEAATGEGFPIAGLLLHSVGDRSAAARVLARHAAEVSARLIAIGPSPRGRGAQFADGSFTVTLARETPCTLALLHPESELDAAAVVQQPA